MPQNPDFSRKMMGFDGGGLVLTSATLRCTKKSTSFDKKLVDFYSSRKAWYVSTACRVWNCR